MSKRIVLPVILSSLFLYSSVSAACAYCYSYNDSGRSGYSENYSKLARDFEDKRYELNKLYDQGVSEADEKAKALIKDLDTLSAQMQKERESVRPYQNDRHRNRSGSNDHCW